MGAPSMCTIVVWEASEGDPLRRCELPEVPTYGLRFSTAGKPIHLQPRQTYAMESLALVIYLICGARRCGLNNRNKTVNYPLQWSSRNHMWGDSRNAVIGAGREGGRAPGMEGSTGEARSIVTDSTLNATRAEQEAGRDTPATVTHTPFLSQAPVPEVAQAGPDSPTLYLKHTTSKDTLEMHQSTRTSHCHAYHAPETIEHCTCLSPYE